MLVKDLDDFHRLVKIMKEYRIDSVKLEGMEVNISIHDLPESPLQKQPSREELIGYAAD